MTTGADDSQTRVDGTAPTWPGQVYALLARAWLGGDRGQLQATTGGPRLLLISIAAGATPRALSARDGVDPKNRFSTQLGYTVE